MIDFGSSAAMADLDPRRLRARAMHYRRTAALVSDDEMRHALLELADKCEAMAEQLEAQDRDCEKS
jgi:hypothetical protein